MPIPLSFLRKFGRVKEVLAQREELRVSRDNLLEERNGLLAANANILREKVDLYEQRGISLRDQSDLSQVHSNLIRDFQALSRERDSLQELLHQKEGQLAEGQQRWLVKDAAGIFLLLDKSSLVDLHVFHHNRWEEDRLEYLIDLMKVVVRSTSDEVYFFDVGSYFGQYSLVVKKEFKDVIVCAFEANPYNFIQLNANVLLNNEVGKIATYNRCVTNLPGRTNVSPPDEENRGAARIGSPNFSSDQSIFIVENIVLDAEFKSVSGGVIFMKMDIEGAEPLALAGMRELVQRNRVVIQIEDWDFPQGDSSVLLREMGFSQLRGMHPDYFYSNFPLSVLEVDAPTES